MLHENDNGDAPVHWSGRNRGLAAASYIAAVVHKVPFCSSPSLNYARMIPQHLAEMQMVQVTDLEIYDEFLEDNWVVNKNPRLPFCSLGVDHALHNKSK